MKFKYCLSSIFLFAFLYCGIGQDNARFSILSINKESLVFAVTPSAHKTFGLKLPITYQLSFATGLKDIQAWERHSAKEPWKRITEKHPSDFFNEEESVRFDNSMAYVSVAFSEATDSLFIQLTSNGQPLIFSYQGIAKYYDNRKAAVTVTSDDWGPFGGSEYSVLFHLFRSRGLYHTFGIETFLSDKNTWHMYQMELDSGMVEAGSHSRTHPHVPYKNTTWEVKGSAEDIRKHLQLPELYRYKNISYVYSWLAPYGNYDHSVDSVVGISGYIAPRLYENLDTTGPREYVYGDSTLKPWDAHVNHFKTCFPTVELGAPDWGVEIPAWFH